MKRFLTLIAVVIGLFCHGQETIKYFENDEELVNIFSEQGVKLLGDILQFYDDWIIEETKLTDIDKAYHTFCESLNECESANEFYKKSKINQKQLDSLITECEINRIFRGIWKFNTGYPGNEKRDTILYVLSYETNSYYWKFLKVIKKDNPVLKEYIRSIVENGTIIPPLALGFPSTHDKFDFSQDRYRLIFAIHFMTVSYIQYFIKINL